MKAILTRAVRSGQILGGSDHYTLILGSEAIASLPLESHDPRHLAFG
ncbi:hypothetical protein DOP62_13525 [Synechococcus elongatus PCC 11801]|uniref:Uncharacterized protein n=1 Tax=Synechococcus elongatus PCC 11801 TaxID=2219813 RepID=A0AAQ3MDH2_SYNEL